jgi:hypothetical protein
MKKIKILLCGMLLFSVSTSTLMAQDSDKPEFEVSVGADLVSSYVWRGSYISGISFQPSIGLSYGGLSLTAWGSSDFNNVVNEFDFTLGYGVGGFSVAVTDYFGPYVSAEVPKYFAKKSHILEGTVGFDFAEVSEKFALSVLWNTNFLNDKNEEGKEQYSTYIELGYPVEVGSVGIDFALGFTPWEGLYSDKFNVVNISVKGSKDIKITESYSLPVFAQAVLNPYTEQVHFVFGLSF